MHLVNTALSGMGDQLHLRSTSIPQNTPTDNGVDLTFLNYWLNGPKADEVASRLVPPPDSRVASYVNANDMDAQPAAVPYDHNLFIDTAAELLAQAQDSTSVPVSRVIAAGNPGTNSDVARRQKRPMGCQGTHKSGTSYHIRSADGLVFQLPALGATAGISEFEDWIKEFKKTSQDIICPLPGCGRKFKKPCELKALDTLPNFD
ncbi:hypothetical protein B0J17DRAFT_719689 [Rhizoctonia solani]|nr:hypothetical protein B0J17DRAFT_719689 [Rhizoctonia solani]